MNWKMSGVKGAMNDHFLHAFALWWSYCWSQPDLWGSIKRADCNMDKHSWNSRWSKHGVYIFFALGFFFCIFHNAIYWMRLERFFSNPASAFSCFSKQGMRHFYFCWDFRLDFVCPVTVANCHGPFLSHHKVLFFFSTLTIHLVIDMQVWIC